MKKIIIIAVLLSMIIAGNSFAQGRGWAVGGAFSFDWMQGSETSVSGASLLLKFPQLPIMFGFSARFSDPDSAFGMTADWWLFQTNLIGPVKLYIGPGVYAFFISGVADSFNIGMRIPFGFQIFIVPAFEIFLEPAIKIEFLPNLPDFGLTAQLGFRFWF